MTLNFLSKQLEVQGRAIVSYWALELVDHS